MRKKIVVSMLVIALAAALLGGATFAWFTDSDSTTATFTAGTLDVALTDTSDAVFTLELTGMAPGDSLSTDIKVANTGNLDLYYRFLFTETAPGGTLDDALTVTISQGATIIADGVLLSSLISGGAIFDNTTMELAPAASATYTIEIELPTDTGNTYKGTSFDGTFVVEATQVKNQADPTNPAWN